MTTTRITTRKPAPKAAAGKKAVPKAAVKRPQHRWLRGLQRELPPLTEALPSQGPLRLLDKHEVCELAGASYPTLWSWMRAGTFPRSRIVGGKSMWLSTEIDAWMANLPLRPLKGDPPEAA